MGTTEEVFQAVGNTPEEVDLSKSLVILGAILVAVAFNMVAEIPSGPFDFEVSSDSTEHLQHFLFRSIAQDIHPGWTWLI